MSNLEALLEKAYRVALGRLPGTEERVLLRPFLQKGDSPTKRNEALGDLCHSLLNLNEFVYID